MQLKIAVVIPVYNGSQYLSQALESLQSQTLLPYEIIIVDDGSTDGSNEILNEWIKRTVGLWNARLIQQTNSGQSAARNRGVLETSADLIAFLDQDDEWLPSHLEALNALFASNNALDWAYSSFAFMDGTGLVTESDVLKVRGYVAPEALLSAMLAQNLMMLPTASLVRRSSFAAIKGFDTQFRGYEDDDLFIRLFENGGRFAFTPEVTVNYRLHTSNDSSSGNYSQSRQLFWNKWFEFSLKHPFDITPFRNRIFADVLGDCVSGIRQGNDEKVASNYHFAIAIVTQGGGTLKQRLLANAMRFPSVFKVLTRVRGL